MFKKYVLFLLLSILVDFKSFSSDETPIHKPTNNNCGTSNSGDCSLLIKYFISSIEKYYEKSAFILDAGCGLGAESYCLLKSGFTNIYSLDPDKKHLEYLKSKVINLSEEKNIDLLKNINLVQGKLPSIYYIDFQNIKWSVVILKNVINFMKGYEIEQTLDFLIKNINDDGVLFIVYGSQGLSKKEYQDTFNAFMNNYNTFKNSLQNDNDFIGLDYKVKYFGEQNGSPFLHFLFPFQMYRLLSNIGFKDVQHLQLDQSTNILIASKLKIPQIFISFIEEASVLPKKLQVNNLLQQLRTYDSNK